MTDENTVLYITGGTGFVGSALAKAWLARSAQHRVIIQTRRPDKCINTVRCSYVADYRNVTQTVFALVNLAGAPIADGRWSEKRKRILEESRIQLTEGLVSATRDAPPKVVVSGSAIGYYGCGQAPMDEGQPAGSGYAAYLCRRWEEAAAPFAEHSRLVVPRLGVVLGPGGALDKLLPLYKLGLGGRIGSGRQWFSWIHRDDLVQVILAAIDSSSWKGPINAVAPHAVQQYEFASTLGRTLKRPVFMPTPALAMRLAFGQMAEELLIGGQRVVPEKLLANGFEFAYPDVNAALAEVIRVAMDRK